MQLRFDFILFFTEKNTYFYLVLSNFSQQGHNTLSLRLWFKNLYGMYFKNFFRKIELGRYLISRIFITIIIIFSFFFVKLPQALGSLPKYCQMPLYRTHERHREREYNVDDVALQNRREQSTSAWSFSSCSCYYNYCCCCCCCCS